MGHVVEAFSSTFLHYPHQHSAPLKGSYLPFYPDDSAVSQPRISTVVRLCRYRWKHERHVWTLRERKSKLYATCRRFAAPCRRTFWSTDSEPLPRQWSAPEHSQQFGTARSGQPRRKK